MSPWRWLAFAVCGVAFFCATAGYSAPPLTGQADSRLQAIDQLLATFVSDHALPGASLAITRQGKLVYARGCGFSDVAKQEAVQPQSLFRIASLSKPITAIAVLQLLERGQLKLEDSILDHLPELVPAGRRKTHSWGQVTIQHCLQHTGGWDSKAKFDPMFRPILIAQALQIPTPPSANNIIRFMATKPTDFPAGERYAYSNFGYNILGRIIEQASGQSYEQYVQEQVLHPVGIRAARLGKTLLKDRAPGEVLYYDQDKTGPSVFAENLHQKVPTPYGVWCLESMDANGGWIMSAVDLTRFAAGLDADAETPLLKPATRKLLFNSRPAGPAGFEADGTPKPVFYGFGWSIRQLRAADHAHLWHQGAVDGASTLMVHRDDNFNWAIVFNSRKKIDGKLPAAAIDERIHVAVNSIQEWPQSDLFSTIDPPAP